eukprot:TRINITY_DN2961_c0_g1_i3.p1 TRINITY_DN2961_c0_g1~~TRINITY_DN2961_c0_g1_i3.p1  ORF type:complete len:143 (+),score=30.30 TRINITY_DN2961_c0_g1_i3:304-732(+)
MKMSTSLAEQATRMVIELDQMLQSEPARPLPVEPQPQPVMLSSSMHRSATIDSVALRPRHSESGLSSTNRRRTQDFYNGRFSPEVDISDLLSPFSPLSQLPHLQALQLQNHPHALDEKDEHEPQDCETTFVERAIPWMYSLG